MKFKVIAPFNDKNEHKLYNMGDIYETDDKARVTELKGYIGEEIKDGPEDKLAPLLDGNAENVNKSVENLSEPELQHVLKLEKEGKKRKTVISHIESLLEEEEGKDDPE